MANSASHPSGVVEMNSNPLMMGYEGGDLWLAGAACNRLSCHHVEPVCAGCEWWLEQSSGSVQ